MAGVAIAAVVVSAVGLISNFLGSKKAASAAKSEATEQARLEGLTTDEKIRRLGIDQRSLYGETLAGYASGGVLARAPSLGGALTLGDTFGSAGDYGGALSVMTGSPGAVIQEQAKEFAFERDITRKVGATKVSQALTRGENVADQYKYAGFSNVATGISSIMANYQAMKSP